ncbi:MAG: hypothetical protein ACOYB1_09710 [Limnohabitans sp.]
MTATLQILHWLAGFVVLAEALNKLERTAPFAPGMCRHDRLVDGLKALAWMLLAIGAGGAVIMPVLGGLGIQAQMNQIVSHQSPSLSETAVLLGFAVLIVRTRVKEG